MRVRAYRYVYGKVVQRPGGPLEPGFEHRPTSVSEGMPDCLLPYCQPVEATGPDSRPASPGGVKEPEPVGLSSTSPVDLVHPNRSREGALYFSPCSCFSERYMVATCLRASRELGSTGLGRTHTQLVSFAFKEADWNQYAPRLLANAGRWLRAEPDLAEFHRRGDFPMAELGPEQLPEVPPCEQGPLPPPGTLLWRLAAALEDKDSNLLVGTADHIDSIPTFLRALACTAALVPHALRIYLTAAAGFREPQAPFAIQYLPEAPAMSNADAGFFQQIAGKLLVQEEGADQQRWQRYWVELARGDKDHGEAMQHLADPGRPGGGRAARRRFTKAIDRLAARHSVKDLEDWLDGTRTEPPSPPTLRERQTGTEWISTLARRLNETVAGRDIQGVDRALTKVADLLDADGAKADLYPRALYWTKAWRSAAKLGGEKYDRSILRWSALGASPLLEFEELRSTALGKSELEEIPENPPGAELGRLKDFSELRGIYKAVQHAKARSPQSAARVNAAVASSAFNRRLENLRNRAVGVLIRHPRSLVDLAASFPSLLKPLAGDQKTQKDTLVRILDTIYIAARVYHWTGKRPPKALAGLDDMARIIAEKSFGISCADGRAGEEHFRQYHADYLRAALGSFWQWRLAPDVDRDTDVMVWRSVTRSILEHSIRNFHLADSANLLWRIYPHAYNDVRQEIPDRTKLKEASVELVDTCLRALGQSRANGVELAAELLRAIPGSANLIPTDEPCRAMAIALWDHLRNAVAKADWSGVEPQAPTKNLLPAFIETLERAGQDKEHKPLPETTWRLLDLFEKLLTRWLQLGIPPRTAVVDVLDRLEELTWRTPGVMPSTRVKSAIPKELHDAIRQLSLTLGDCLLAWTRTAPPEPCLGSSRTPGESPIRRELAQTLGFPLCAYFGGLTPVNNRKMDTVAIDKGFELRQRLRRSREDYQRVIAYGAPRCWKVLFDGTPQERGYLNARLQEKESAEALEAIEYVIGNPPDWHAYIDSETWFTVAFFASLRESGSRTAEVEFPPTLKDALLSNGTKHLTSYPIQLGRLIANGDSDLGHRLRRVFEAPEKNRIFAARVALLPESGWAGFSSLEADEKRAKMLRVLFALALIVNKLANQTNKTRAPIDCQHISQAMQVQDAAAKDSVKRFFDHPTNQNYRDAFRDAIKLSGLEGLPSWPDSIQPCT